MSLTRTDLEDLTAGTIVEYRRDVWPAGSCIRGPLESFGSDRSLYILTGLFGVRQENGDPYEPRAEITVIADAEAEPSLYVNHPRTKPVPGDVMIPVSHSASDVATWSWCPLGSGSYRWRETQSDTWIDPEELDDDLLLLVDGETGMTVPQ